jgi:phospholipase C
MLGFLYSDNGNVSHTGFPINGLTGQEWNPDDAGNKVLVYKIKATDGHPYLMPGADPGEGFQNTNNQLFSAANPLPGTKADNMGFVKNFKAAIASDNAKNYKDTIPGTIPSEIMAMYSSELLPVMSGLAKGFAVCDTWFSSAPTQTIPNRAFAGAGTSQGHLDNHVKIFTCPSIYGRLSDVGQNWAIYGYNSDPLTRHDFPDTQGADVSHFGQFPDFKARAAAGNLPEYTFLEPSFGANGNSQHPNYDVAAGEQLIHDVYYALRQNEDAWKSTLLIITYDEHGGNYDHVAPPMDATPPGDGTVGEWGFDFTRFGVRVPALLISPLIAAGTVFRATTGYIDHTSVLKTIAERWNTKPLTNRDNAAASLGDVLTLAVARTDDPIAGVTIPVSTAPHPNLSKPSSIDLVHAERIANLPIRNQHGYYDATPPSLPDSSAEIGNFIRDRSAAWNQEVREIVNANKDSNSP